MSLVQVRAGGKLLLSFGPHLRYHKIMDAMPGQEKKIAKKRGRPATGTSPTIGVRVADALRLAIDDWRARQRPIPSRPEAIRQLAELGLRKK